MWTEKVYVILLLTFKYVSGNLQAYISKLHAEYILETTSANILRCVIDIDGMYCFVKAFNTKVHQFYSFSDLHAI